MILILSFVNHGALKRAVVLPKNLGQSSADGADRGSDVGSP